MYQGLGNIENIRGTMKNEERLVHELGFVFQFYILYRLPIFTIIIWRTWLNEKKHSDVNGVA